MCRAFNAGIVNRLLPPTTNRSMLHALTASTNHLLLPGPPARTAGPDYRPSSRHYGAGSRRARPREPPKGDVDVLTRRTMPAPSSAGRQPQETRLKAVAPLLVSRAASSTLLRALQGVRALGRLSGAEQSISGALNAGRVDRRTTYSHRTRPLPARPADPPSGPRAGRREAAAPQGLRPRRPRAPRSRKGRPAGSCLRPQ